MEEAESRKVKSQADKDRIQRLVDLSEVWARCYFFHPSLANTDDWWLQALVDVIPEVEAATTAASFAEALNAVLSHLDFPECRAVIPGTDSKTNGSTGGPLIRTRLLPSGVLYADCSRGEAHSDRKFLQKFADIVSRASDTKGLILDLRWKGQGGWPSPWPGALGFFIRRNLVMPEMSQRVQLGWTEIPGSVYSEFRQSRASDPLLMIRKNSNLFGPGMYGGSPEEMPTYLGPLTFIRNWRAAAFDPYLMTLKRSRGASIVHEPSNRAIPEVIELWGGVSAELPLWVSADRKVFIPDAEASGREAISIAERLVLGEKIKSPGRKRKTRRKPKSTKLMGDIPKRFESAVGIAGLFKLWHVLKTFDLHIEFADIDFDRDLPKWIRKVERAPTYEEFMKVVSELGVALNDSHVGSWHPKLLLNLGHQPPVTVSFVEDKFVVSGISGEATEPKPGWIISKVDGRNPEEIAGEVRRRISSSTPQVFNLRAAARLLAGEKDSEVEVEFLSPSGLKTIMLKRTEAFQSLSAPREGPIFRKLSSGFGYIDLDRIGGEEEFGRALRAVRSTPGLVLDMRGYPKFFIQVQGVGRLIERPVSGTKFVFPYRTANTTALQLYDYEVQPHETLRYLKPLVVLINAAAMSAAEDFCIYLKNAGRATFVGSPTAGTNGNVTTIRLPYGGIFMFTGMRVLFGDYSLGFRTLGLFPTFMSKQQ